MTTPSKSRRPGATMRVPVVAVDGATRRRRIDVLTTEEPLEIRVGVAGAAHRVAVTMRTPGHDFELAAGFLFGEGLIAGRSVIRQIRYCADPQNYNVVTVDLAPGTAVDLGRLTRHGYTTSSCGVCGKASLELVRAALPQPPPRRPAIVPAAEVLRGLPPKLRAAQAVFARTGGLHAAALFSAAGELELLREDVGRHNAVDKVIGARLLAGQLPVGDGILVVSGRASFELVQKAVMAGLPVLVAIGAPSSLAVDLAREFGVALVGFLRDGRYNEYG